MLSLWNLYLLLPLSLPLSFHVTVLTGENVKETQRPDTDTRVQHLTQSSQRPHGSGLAPGNAMFVPESIDSLGLPITWPLSSSEETDRQGVIGEYTDIQESSETSLLYGNERGRIISRPTEGAAEDATFEDGIQPSGGAPPQPDTSTLTTNGSTLHPTHTGENQTTLPARRNETFDSYLPFLLSDSLPSDRSDQDSTSPLSTGLGPSPDYNSPPVATGSWGWTTGSSVNTQGKIQEGTVPLKETGHAVNNVDGILQTGVVVETEKGKSLLEFP